MSKKKAQSTYYLPPDVVQEMEHEGIRVGHKFPSKFILFLWEFYKENKRVTPEPGGKVKIRHGIPRPDKE